MNNSKISVRYAKALFQIATQNGCEDQVRDDMSNILTCINTMPDFKILLDSPVLADDVKIETFKQMFGQNICPLTLDFFKLLVKNKRENYLKIICLNYSGYYNRNKNITKVLITSAVESSSELNNSIKDLVIKSNPGCKVELSTQIDNSIIGGVIINVDDKQYDASVKTQLSIFKDKLINNK